MDIHKQFDNIASLKNQLEEEYNLIINHVLKDVFEIKVVKNQKLDLINALNEAIKKATKSLFKKLKLSDIPENFIQYETKAGNIAGMELYDFPDSIKFSIKTNKVKGGLPYFDVIVKTYEMDYEHSEHGEWCKKDICLPAYVFESKESFDNYINSLIDDEYNKIINSYNQHLSKIEEEEKIKSQKEYKLYQKLKDKYEG